LEENERVVELANEAIKLAENLKKDYLKDCTIIIRDQAILFFILKKMSQIQLGLKIQEAQQEELFSLHYFQELAKLNQMRLGFVKGMNDSLLNLISNKHVFYYLFALSISIDSITNQVMIFSAFNKTVLDQERKLRQQFIEQIESTLTGIFDLYIKVGLLRSLANYYYWMLRPEKAASLLSEALNLARKDDNKAFVEGNDKLLERMKSTPDPYEITNDIEIDEMTVEEYQEMTKKLLVGQGISLEGNDHLTTDISMALRDMNPKSYFQFCEHLRIRYVNTSVVGASIGLPSMGAKFVWCKHCKSSIQGFDLQGIFDIFQKENCESCSFLKSRDKEWKCYVKWMKDQQKDLPEFKEP
jgi:tetratricopeptide (TPR) repeat protein